MSDLQFLVRNLTVEEFTQLCGSILTCAVILCAVLVFGYNLFKFIFDIITFFIRKDKYKSPDWSFIHISRYIRRLRRSALNARSQNEYFLYYNRLVGAVELAIELGYYTNESTVKILDVPNKNL